MARKRLDKTPADYLAIAVTPVLIMLLVGSLVYFLQALSGTGSSYAPRVRWILFWFVLGMVLIARISIESGRAQSSMFTAALAGATALAIFKFVPDGPWIPIACLAVIWWCTDKLTWDCTLIDESEDASGEGLLQVAGVDDGADLTQSTDSSDPNTEEQVGGDHRVPLWKRLFLNVGEREGKPHAPGLWVVYFSLAALPIFGFGQTMIPASRASARGFAFNCLLIYVASGLGLLLLTSFLGLRRYLRQRQLQMPSTMAATWVGMGATIAIGILIVALLIPRPQGDYSVVDLIDRAGDRVQEAADVAFLNGSGVDDDGQRSGEASPDTDQGAADSSDQQGQPGGQQNGNQNSGDGSQGDQGQATPQPSEDGQSAGQSSEQQSGDSQQSGSGQTSQQSSGQQQQQQQQQQRQGQSGSNQNPESGRQTQQQEQSQQSGQQDASGQNSDGQSQQQNGDQGNQQDAGNQNAADAQQGDGSAAEEPSSSDSAESPEYTPPDMSSVFGSIGALFKWIMYGLLAAIGLWLLFLYRKAIANFFLKLWTELLSLFGGRSKPPEAAVAEEAEPAAPLRPFAAFRNPFASGAAAQHSPSELVRYTFEALQAWGFENGCPRSPDQTPMEYGQQLKGRKLPFASEASDLSQLYARVAYAGYRPQSDNLALLEKLWRKMGQA